MKSDQIEARPQSQSHLYLQRSIGIAALLCLAFGALIPTSAAAADREALYYKAEDLIRYTNDVKGRRALIAQGVDVKRPGQNSRTGARTASRSAQLWAASGIECR